jgi:hypothetical protein
MSPALRVAFAEEMELAATALKGADHATAFPHFERAHILGQRDTWMHLRSHVGMLRVGWQRRDAGELFGQLTRLLAAALFSRIWVPVGNTGGANVSALRPMPIPEDLQRLLADGSP